MKKKYLITSALPYINGIKHLGNLAGSLLPADVHARHLRQQGEQVLFICGTDEHGTPAELAAQTAAQEVREFCDHMHEVQKKIYHQFNISTDFFGRSSCQENHELTQAMFEALEQHGHIEERTTQQVYSEADQRFLPDRYVIGECPHCGDPKARGDQCDGCGKLLDPTELINPRSAISGSDQVQVKNTKHLYLKLDELQDACHQWLQTNQHNWPTVSQGIATKWLQEGLQPRCITRDLNWGVSIPKKGYENKVFYVWFDAPVAYISMTMAWAKQQGHPDAWRQWWQPKNQQDVCYSQFMAKDNVPFHAIFWPAMLLGTQQPWKMVDQLKAVNWLTYDGGKFSTSQGRGIFTDQALALFPADYWRYYLISIAPESADADFNFTHFAQTINKDLADTLGNFAGRVTALLERHCDGRLPILSKRDVPEPLLQSCQGLMQSIDDHLRQCKFRQASQHLKSLWMLGNEYITREQPWSTIKHDPEHAKATLTHCVWLLRCMAVASSAFIPETAETILALMHQDKTAAQTSYADIMDLNGLPVGHPIKRATALFQKITSEQTQGLTEQYQGKVSD
jgi:methionyl-tRNA synthetase